MSLSLMEKEHKHHDRSLERTPLLLLTLKAVLFASPDAKEIDLDEL